MCHRRQVSVKIRERLWFFLFKFSSCFHLSLFSSLLINAIISGASDKRMFISKSNYVYFTTVGLPLWVNAKTSRGSVYIQPVPCRNVRNLRRQIQDICVLQIHRNVTVITNACSRRSEYILYEAALFCHSFPLLIICISVYLCRWTSVLFVWKLYIWRRKVVCFAPRHHLHGTPLTCARTMPSRMTLVLFIHLLRSSDAHSSQKQTGRSAEVTQ